MDKKYYSIGKTSEMCGVSTRMLRYYEEIKLFEPDYIDKSSHYRYYTIDSMRTLQTIRYLVDLGFSLEEIKPYIEDFSMDTFQEIFMKKINETEQHLKTYSLRLEAIKGWCSLLIEGKTILNGRQDVITTRYIPSQRYVVFDRPVDENGEDSDIYLETEYFTFTKKNNHTMIDFGGAFNMVYESFKQRINGTYTHERLIQKYYETSDNESGTAVLGGFSAIVAYHIGSRKNIRDTYERMLDWADKHNFKLRGDCNERHILDFYSVEDEAMYVTEVMLPIEEDCSDLELLRSWDNKL